MLEIVDLFFSFYSLFLGREFTQFLPRGLCFDHPFLSLVFDGLSKRFNHFMTQDDIECRWEKSWKNFFVYLCVVRKSDMRMILRIVGSSTISDGIIINCL